MISTSSTWLSRFIVSVTVSAKSCVSEVMRLTILPEGCSSKKDISWATVAAKTSRRSCKHHVAHHFGREILADEVENPGRHTQQQDAGREQAAPRQRGAAGQQVNARAMRMGLPMPASELSVIITPPAPFRVIRPEIADNALQQFRSLYCRS
jgi:hypothetical protein